MQFCVFETPFGGLRATYDDHLRLIEKHVLDIHRKLSLSPPKEVLETKDGRFP